MSDTISRQSAIDGLRDYLVGKRCPDDGTLTCRLIENEVINKLTPIQPEPHWIPVTEKPKEEKKSYWVCLEDGGQCQCRWTNDIYGIGANPWSKWGWKKVDLPQFSKVVAYMPLPEPYKGVNT